MVYHIDNKIVHGLFVYDFREYLLNNTFIALFPSIKDLFYDYKNGLSLEVLSQVTKNKTYTPKNTCSGVSKDRFYEKYLA